MKVLSWIRERRPPVRLDPEKEAEKKELKAELAQAVVTFGRRRSRVQNIAEAAVGSMRESRR